MLSILMACGPSGDDFRIRGEIRGMEQSELYLYSLEGSEPRVDTIRVNEGRFVYAGHAHEATPFTLVFPNAVEQVIYASGGSDLTYEAVASDLRNYRVKGTKENELLNEFRDDTRRANPIETRDRAEQYIREHTSSPAVLYLFERYFIQDASADLKKMMELHELLEREHGDSPLLLMLGKALEDAAHGQVGQTVSLPDSLNTPADCTLLYFWATWQPVAWGHMSDLRKAVNAHQPNQLQAITISVDATDEQWKNYVHTTDTTHIKYVYDGLSWDTPLARQLNVTRLPTYIILNRKKRIVSRFEQASELEKELKKALAQ